MKYITQAIIAASLLLGACAENPATGGQRFTLVSAAQEREVGQQTAEAALKQYGMYKPESRATQYVLNLCNKTWAVTEEASQPVSCIFLDSDQFNAWATPGYVNVYRGLLPYVSSEAELVAVIGHETGHVNAHHVGQRITQQTLFNILTSAAAIYVGAKTNDSNAANMAYTVGGLAAGAAVMSYSRQDELQADQLGQRYMAKLGYDPRESVQMITAMQAKENYDKALSAAFNGGRVQSESFLGKIYASHPATPDRRIQAIQTSGGEPDGSVRLPQGIQPAMPKNDLQGRIVYHNAIDGLTFGPQRKFGVAGRGYLAIPNQRLQWSLPDGFVLDYAEAEKSDDFGLWRGVHPQSRVTLQITAMPYKAGMNVAYALQDIFGADIGTPERLSMKSSSVTAYTATLPPSLTRTKATRIIAVPLTATDKLAILAYQFPSQGSQQAEEQTLIEIAQQSVFLTESAAARIQPLKISTFDAQSGDTVAKRAAGLPQGALQQEHFRALNGLTPSEELVKGKRYKTIVDPNV